MSEQSASDSSARLPFAGTTSDGQAADLRPVRKIKPPSQKFFDATRSDTSEEGAAVRASVDVARAAVPRPIEVVRVTTPSPPVETSLPAAVELSGPATGAAADELAGPAPLPQKPRVVVEPVAPSGNLPPVDPPRPTAPASAPAPEPAPKPVVDSSKISPEARAQSAYTQERLQAELRELDQIVHSLDSLNFLKARLKKTYDEGADAITLVSFYRLTARALLDEVNKSGQTSDQFRREFESMRSRTSRLELELATAEAQAPRAAPVADPAAVAPLQARIASLETDLAQVNEQREKLLVDFKNARERAQRDLELKIFKEKEKFFRNFLPVLDSFERASQTMNDSSGTQSLLEGFKMISGQLAEALKLEGLETVDSTGVFDPRFHEAVSFVETQEKADDHVFDELSRGYQVGERLIRPAMVRVARNSSGIVIPATPPPEEAEKVEPVAEGTQE